MYSSKLRLQVQAEHSPYHGYKTGDVISSPGGLHFALSVSLLVVVVVIVVVVVAAAVV